MQQSNGIWGFVARTIILTLATILAIRLIPGVRIIDANVWAAFLTALVIALLDNFIRPILIFITLPFTVLSFGLFIFIINAIIIEITAAIVGPFEVDNFAYALLFSLVITILNYLLELPRKWLSRPTYTPRSENNENHDTVNDEFTDYEEIE